MAELDVCTVLHVDMDSFFASVEVLDDPALVGRPVIVGGTGARGVVASCTYEARAHGVRSAMPSMEARRRCPQAVFLAGRFDRYSEVSELLHAVLRRFSPVVEGIALDEAFVDVAGARRLLGPPVQVAHDVRRAVHEGLSLQCSVGVARSKLLAKLASRAAKPTPSPSGPVPGPGVVAVAPSQELTFLHPLPVRALWGVGPATARRLEALGVTTVGQLAALPVDVVRRVLGEAHGRALAALARADDPRPVVADAGAKSVGHEETFATDLREPSELHRQVARLADGVGERLRRGGRRGRTVTLKVRFADRATLTRSHSLSTPVDSPRAIGAVAEALLGGVEVGAGVRLLGVSVSSLVEASVVPHQLSFGDDPPASATDGSDLRPAPAGAGTGHGEEGHEESPEEGRAWHEVEAAVTAVRRRYGHASVGPAALVGRAGLAVKERGDTQWGPSDADATAGNRRRGGNPR